MALDLDLHWDRLGTGLGPELGTGQRDDGTRDSAGSGTWYRTWNSTENRLGTEPGSELEKDLVQD